jgi:hypothetical protein
MKRLVVLLGLGCLLAACGGSSSHTVGSAPKVERKAGLLGGKSESAGNVISYRPTGKIVADDGFRPWVNGFSFENYGNDVGPQNMTAAEVEDLFGKQVCLRGTGVRCKLTPIAQEWMATENSRMAGGHCMGFSVTSIEFYKGVRSTKNYGAKNAYGLPIRGNIALQSLLAENWTFQDLPSVANRRVAGRPIFVLRQLVNALNDPNGEVYTIAIFKRDGTGGHAVTPFAVEDRGSGKYAILVYDNNFPGVIRAIRVDTRSDSWRYIGGPDPSDTSELYDGDARTKSLSLFPTSPGVAQQPCPFCAGSRRAGNGGAGSATGSVLTPAKQYDQVSLVGNPLNHGHLILRDGKGNTTGFVDGRIVNEIPGVRVQTTITSQNWNVAPEPTYLIPPKTAVTVIVDGHGLNGPDKEKIDMIGPGVYQQVDQILLEPGEKNAVYFRTGATGMTYFTDPHRFQTPLLASAVQDGKTQYAFAVEAVGVKGGSALTMYVDEKDGQVALDTEGTKGGIAHTGYAVYVLSIVRQTAAGESVWLAGKLLLKKGDLAVVDYRHAVAGKTLDVVTGPLHGKVTFQKAEPQK